MSAISNTRETWGVYIRVSTRQQVEQGFSLDDQRDTLIRYARDRGWTWELFEDAGISGETLDNRPGMVALLDAADRGRIGGVLVVDESRLARDEFIAALIRQRLKAAGVRVATPSRGEYDLSDPSDNFAANVLAAAHAFEQDIRTAKMRAGRRRAAEAGYWTGGPPPFGFHLVASPDGRHKMLELDDQQAAVIRLVWDLIVNQGYTTHSATTYLNAHEYKTSRGQPWRPGNLCFRLRQPTIGGTWIYRDNGVPIEITIPAILTFDEWQQLQSAIKGTPRPQRKNRLYPLTGRDRCHVRCSCGGNYFGKVDTSKRGRSYYECSRNSKTFGEDRCKFRPRVTQSRKLDAAVWDAVRAVLTDEEYLTDLALAYVSEVSTDAQEDDTEGLERILRGLRTQETTIVRELAGRGSLSDEVLRPALEEIINERRTVEKELQRMAAAADQSMDAESVEQQVRRLARTARDRLSDPTVELMAEVFDLIELDLIRVDGGLYEGVGRLPILTDDGNEGEVWIEGPPSRGPRRPRSGPAASPGPASPDPGG